MDRELANEMEPGVTQGVIVIITDAVALGFSCHYGIRYLNKTL